MNNTSSTKVYEIPTWVIRELRRLERMAQMGGSSSALEFERQIVELKKKYIWPLTRQ